MSGPTRGSSIARVEHRIPVATVGRLPIYLRALLALETAGTPTVSSSEIAEAAGVNPAQVRKDLSHLRASGTRGVGYDVAGLIEEIRSELGLDRRWPVVIAGAGNLGRALANYGGFGERGFEIVAVVDADPAKIGRPLGPATVEPLADLAVIVAERGAAIGLICTPAEASQEVADQMVAAGLHSILNFAPAPVVVPAGVSMRRVDLSGELQILAFHELQRQAAEPA